MRIDDEGHRAFDASQDDVLRSAADACPEQAIAILG
jgi:ferredoxin